MSVSRLRSSLLSQSSSPFLSVELDVDFGCRTKFSQGYHIRNVIAWTEQNVEEFVGSFRLEFDNIIVRYAATSAVSRRTALSTSLVDCFDCSYVTLPILDAHQYLNLPTIRVLPLSIPGEPLSSDFRRFFMEPRKCKYPTCQRVYMYFTAHDPSVSNGVDGGPAFIVMKIPRYNECIGSYHYFYRYPRV